MLAQSPPLDLVLSTDNEALFSVGGPAFYQYIDREYKKERSYPWEGGQYGFVRDPVETSQGLVYTRFHEGIDIRCLHRDPRGEPLDEVRAIADGKVVHANLVAGYSNYGKYIVIEHIWGGCSYFSLYGHLSEIAVGIGQEVHRGERIATMGYTGAGLNQARAHLHLELNVMLNRNFEGWYAAQFKKEPNRNGIYNGLNLAGLDIARLFLALRKNPKLTIPEFLAGEETFYKVTLPRTAGFELHKMYPWMVTSRPGTESWEVSFTRSAFPLRIEPSERKVGHAQLTYVKESPIDCSLLTQRHVAGLGKKAHFTDAGQRLMQLFIYPE
jgi:murein DD-endopeptidase MepM/ murein hydrolase activator NlpD